MQSLLQWKSNKNYIFWVWFYIHHAMLMRHIAICGLLLSTIFSTLSHKRHDFFFKNKTLLNVTFVFGFPYKLSLNISHSKKTGARYDEQCILVVMLNTRYSCPILIQLKYSRQFFEKYSNVKLHENPSSGSRVVPCGQTWRS